MKSRQWEHRHSLIKSRITTANADIVCIQEADGDTFEDDFAFMMNELGYDYVLHKKFRFRCATFYKVDKFVVDKVAHKDRTLVTALRSLCCDGGKNSTTNNDTQQKGEDDNILYIINCHLSGGAQPERRLRQVHDGLDQIRKWNNVLDLALKKLKKQGKRQLKNIAKSEVALAEYQNAGIVVCGDFNSDGNTAVRKLLVDGYVEPDWFEPQYPTLQLTSKRKAQLFGTFTDAAELAYGGNVCDGGYSENNIHSLSGGIRPATYVVPNLASLLLLPVRDEEIPRTQFGMQVAKGLAATLNLKDFCQSEIDDAFDSVDEDGNGIIDQDEVLVLLESAYLSTYGAAIEQERNHLFRGFGTKPKQNTDNGMTKEQFISRLKALQQDVEGERKAYGLTKGLNLQELSEMEMEKAFDAIDLDGNGLLDDDEFQTLLEELYVSVYGEEISNQRAEFFASFSGTTSSSIELTREQFTDRLLALHQELEGGRNGADLAEVKTAADAEKVIERFTPLLQNALDYVFDKFSTNGIFMTQDELNDYLIKTNGKLCEGGMFEVFEKQPSESSNGSIKAIELTRQDWYSAFARELSEGKWWQVVYDLEVCGFNIRSHNMGKDEEHQFYQAWLDYVYFQRLNCSAVQDVLTEDERSLLYSDGDALPNEWHPSDHLPVAVVFSWKV